MEKKHTLLIVEDEETAARALERKFRTSGFETVICNDGECALEAISKQPFDAILLDLVMPKKDGYEVLKELNEKKNTIPVVVLSNLFAESDAARAKALGATEHFVKSMTPMKNVVTFIVNLLQKKQS